VAEAAHPATDSFSLFGGQYAAALTLKVLLAAVVLAAAPMQVLPAPWMYRKLPFVGSAPRPVRLAHRLVRFALLAVTVPIALRRRTTDVFFDKLDIRESSVSGNHG
jgi:hypothetical protein